MAVIPIRPGLNDGKPVGKGFSRRDSGKTDAGHAVLCVGKDQSVPVDRCPIRQVVGDVDRDLFPLLEPEDRARRLAVVADAAAGEVASIDCDAIHREIVRVSLNAAAQYGEEAETERTGPDQADSIHGLSSEKIGFLGVRARSEARTNCSAAATYDPPPISN